MAVASTALVPEKGRTHEVKREGTPRGAEKERDPEVGRTARGYRHLTTNVYKQNKEAAGPGYLL